MNTVWILSIENHEDEDDILEVYDHKPSVEEIVNFPRMLIEEEVAEALQTNTKASEEGFSIVYVLEEWTPKSK